MRKEDFFLFYREKMKKTLVSFGEIVYNVVYACTRVKIEGGTAGIETRRTGGKKYVGLL